jgi:hypothetical protein
MDNSNIPLVHIFAYFLSLLLKKLFLSCFFTRSS